MNAVRSLVEVRVPDMGNFKDVAVIDVLVKPGDTVAIDSPLVTLESDKATMDVPSTAVGVVEKIHTNKGGKVNTGDLIATVRANGSVPPAAAPASPPAAGGVARVGAATQATATPANTPPSRTAAAPPPAARGVSPAAAPERASAPEAGAAPAAAVATTLRSDLAPIDEPGFSRAHAGPSVRKFARELGVDLARVIGHGFKGRITHEDVKSFVKSAL
ncbi:MAG: branched-chain alpha-keto acid dehydrogenase subunit E2, partial [Gammaproteobacteria bacterium]